jgi:cytochrome c2
MRKAGAFWGLSLLAMTLACSPHPGKAFYAGSGCPACHGMDRSGTDKGPPLKDLRYVWTPETMEAYLKDPAAYVARDKRLQALKQQYRTIMPKFELTDEERQLLIAYLLSQEE